MLKYSHGQRRIYSWMKHAFALSTVFVLTCLLVACLRGPRLQELQSTALKIADVAEYHQTFKNKKFPLVEEFELRSRKKFDNEEARLIGFPLKRNRNETTKGTPKTIFLATRFFGEWNPRHYYFLHLGNETFTRYQCPIDSCYVTNRPSDVRKSDAVLFHLRDLEVFSLPSFRLPEQIWILYSMEPPWLEVRDMRRFNGVFNWTMSYRRGSDVLLSYGFVAERRYPAQLDGNHLFANKRDRAVWYVSNCRTDSNREEYVRRLRSVYPVDVIGGCGADDCRPAETKRCYTKMDKSYKFYLSFENAICRDYVTEKLYNALEHFVVPVTFGGADYSDLTPPRSVINALGFRSPEELGRFLWKVSRNRSLYLSYFEWKRNYRSYLQPWMCDLCEKLQGPVAPKTVHNLDTWWNEGGSCRRWSTEGLQPISSPVFPRYNHRLF